MHTKVRTSDMHRWVKWWVQMSTMMSTVQYWCGGTKPRKDIAHAVTNGLFTGRHHTTSTVLSMLTDLGLLIFLNFFLVHLQTRFCWESDSQLCIGYSTVKKKQGPQGFHKHQLHRSSTARTHPTQATTHPTYTTTTTTESHPTRATTLCFLRIGVFAVKLGSFAVLESVRDGFVSPPNIVELEHVFQQQKVVL
jgi:hypothetical protein